MSSLNARVLYIRVLAQFGRLVEGARKHQQMTIDHLSALSGITVRRLTKYETASAPPHWADALRLAQVLDIRMSFISAALRQPLIELSLDEYRSFVAFVYTQGAQQRQELREDMSRERMITWKTAPMSEFMMRQSKIGRNFCLLCSETPSWQKLRGYIRSIECSTWSPIMVAGRCPSS